MVDVFETEKLAKSIKNLMFFIHFADLYLRVVWRLAEATSGLATPSAKPPGGLAERWQNGAGKLAS